jgi:hypothetical protein
MRTTIIFLLAAFCAAQDHERTEKDIEKDIEKAFKAAYANRSDELGDFFNKTFSPGGDAEEYEKRFEAAWKDASEGVRRFVNETYWNISKTMRGENTSYPTESLEDVTALISEKVREASEKRGKEAHASKRTKTSEEGKPEEHGSILDTAWNYFKSVFGVSTKGEPPVAGLAQDITLPRSSGLTLGVFTLLAGVMLLIQAGLNRNSWINKPLASSDIGCPPEVPSGYVRIV